MAMLGYTPTGNKTEDNLLDATLFPDSIAYNALFKSLPDKNPPGSRDCGNYENNDSQSVILVLSQNESPTRVNAKWLTSAQLASVPSTLKSFWSKIAKHGQPKKLQNDYDSVIEEIYEAYILESPVFLQSNISQSLLLESGGSPGLQSAALTAANFVKDHYHKLANKSESPVALEKVPKAGKKALRRASTVRSVFGGVGALLGLKEGPSSRTTHVKATRGRRSLNTSPKKGANGSNKETVALGRKQRGSQEARHDVFNQLDPNKAGFTMKYKERVHGETHQPRKLFKEAAEPQSTYIGSENLTPQAIDETTGASKTADLFRPPKMRAIEYI